MDEVITDLINAGVQFIELGLDYSIDTSGLINNTMTHSMERVYKFGIGTLSKPI